MKLKLTLLLAFIVLILAACSSSQSENKNEVKTGKSKMDGVQATSTKTLTGNEFTIVAKPATLKLNSKVSVEAWTFNGSVLGSQIRVKEWEKIKINLKNELPEPVSIHWHGITVPNEMDGIPGLT